MIKPGKAFKQWLSRSTARFVCRHDDVEYSLHKAFNAGRRYERKVAEEDFYSVFMKLLEQDKVTFVEVLPEDL